MPYSQHRICLNFHSFIEGSVHAYVIFEHDKFLSLQIKVIIIIIIFDETIASQHCAAPCRKLPSGVDIREDSMYLVSTQRHQCEPTRSA